MYRRREWEKETPSIKLWFYKQDPGAMILVLSGFPQKSVKILVHSVLCAEN